MSHVVQPLDAAVVNDPFVDPQTDPYADPFLNATDPYTGDPVLSEANFSDPLPYTNAEH